MIRPSFPNGLREGGVVAIARRLDPAAVPAVADGLAEGGLRAFTCLQSHGASAKSHENAKCAML